MVDGYSKTVIVVLGGISRTIQSPWFPVVETNQWGASFAVPANELRTGMRKWEKKQKGILDVSGDSICLDCL